jgi:hypothetical protein
VFLFFKVVAKTKRPSFSNSLGALTTQLSNIGANVEYTPLLLGSFLSPDPLVAILPKPQEKNTHCEEVILPCIDWLDTVAKFPLRASKIPDLVALCYPKVSQEMLLAALVDISGLFIYDDYIDKIAAHGNATILLQEQQSEMHLAFANPQDYLTKPDSEKTKFVKMVSEMGAFLRKALPHGASLQDVQIAFSGYLDAMVDETEIRNSFVNAYSTGDMRAVLHSDERHFLRLRSRSSGVEFVFSLCAVFDGFSLNTSGSRASYIVDNAICSCGDAIGVFNDITTLRKDLVEGLTENLVLIIAEKSFFAKVPEITNLEPESIRQCLFYRDLCTVKALDESPALLEKSVTAIQEKYSIRMDPEELAAFLTQNKETFLETTASKFDGTSISFKKDIFELWITTLQSAIEETTEKYFNKEVVAFYKSIDSCKQAAKSAPHRFPPELFIYFDRLETWLSGSSWWSIDPENKRYNWWMPPVS